MCGEIYFLGRFNMDIWITQDQRKKSIAINNNAGSDDWDHNEEENVELYKLMDKYERAG